MNARCGRCGLWQFYPDDHPEEKWDGVCLWYQTRLKGSEVFQARTCADFVEQIPPLTPLQHFDYKVKRDNLGDAYETARRSKRLALFGAGVSIISLCTSIWRLL